MQICTIMFLSAKDSSDLENKIQEPKEDVTMVQLIVGSKGDGKTKHLLDRVNSQIKTASGNIVYLDNSAKHMHELDNKVRLINVTDYPLKNCDEFIGFICGIISQDYDLEQMYLDSFLKIAHLEGQDLTDALTQLNQISEQFKIGFCVSISVEEKDLPDFAKEQVIISC